MNLLKVTFNGGTNMVLSGRRFKDREVYFNNCVNLLIDNCIFEGCFLNIYKCTNARVINSTFTNSVRHAVQFNQCAGGQILNNRFTNPVGTSRVEDVINLYKSNGTAALPIRVENNILVGGGPSASGGGIMLGDNMGNYQIARNNTCTDVGQYGIAIAGGNYNSILNNTVNGAKHDWSNVGIYVWGIPARGSTVDHATVTGNKVNWINRTGARNDWWLGPRVSNLTERDNSFSK